MQLKQTEMSEDAGSVGQLGVRYNEFKVSVSLPGGDTLQGVGNACLSEPFSSGCSRVRPLG